MTGKTVFIYKRMKYHGQFKSGKSFKTSGFFRSHGIFLDKISVWNGMSREWKYWESMSDRFNNLNAEPEPLPVFQIGWYGPYEHNGEFNHGS